MKSFFLTLHIFLNLALSFYAANQFISTQKWQWLALLLSSLPALLVPLYRRFFSEFFCHLRDPWLMVPSLLALALVLIGDTERGQPLTLTFLSLVSLLIYLYFSTAISTGAQQSLPQKNDEVVLPELDKSSEKVLLLVVRGSWCPYAAMQLRQLAKVIPTLKEKQIAVAVLSLEPAGTYSKLFPGMDVTWLSDPQLQQRYGWVMTGAAPLGLSLLGFPRDALVPALLLIRRGRVEYVEHTENVRLLPNLEELLPRLDALLK